MKRSNSGFTLIEVMIVVAIVAIILTVALPAYFDQIRKTKRSLAKSELMSIMARQEQFFVNNKRYATSMTDLGYAANPFAIDADGTEVLVTAGSRIYTVQFAAGATTTAFTLQAVPQLDQAKDVLCGTLAVTSLGAKSATGSGAGCW